MEIHELKTTYNSKTGYTVTAVFTTTRQDPEVPKITQVFENLDTDKEVNKKFNELFKEYGPDRPYADEPIYADETSEEPATYIRGWRGEKPADEVIVDGFTYYRVQPVGRYDLWVKWDHNLKRYIDLPEDDKEIWKAIKAQGGEPDLYDREDHPRRICHVCGKSVLLRMNCTQCLYSNKHRKDASEMTTEERYQELDKLFGPKRDLIAEIPVGYITTRINELVGRPVYTHELRSAESLEGLLKEVSKLPGLPIDNS